MCSLSYGRHPTQPSTLNPSNALLTHLPTPASSSGASISIPASTPSIGLCTWTSQGISVVLSVCLFVATHGHVRRNVLGKGSGERLLGADLLAADETVDRDGNGPVNILRGAVFGETHLAKGLGDTHDGF